MEPYWRSHLHKVADLVCEIPVGNAFWPTSMHEPLILAFLFPFTHSEPWQLKGISAMLEVARKLRGMWKGSEVSQRAFLHKLWSEQRKLAHLSPGMVQQVLRGGSGFELPHCSSAK